ncbi:MAG: zinc finger domain-containing protein [Patescibacteria group bacterium]
MRKTYQKEGEPCPRCGTLIKRVKIGGRSAHFCPKCQKI